MSRSTRRRNVRQSLRLERLEARQVFATDMLLSTISAIEEYQRQRAYQYVVPGEQLNVFADQAALDAKLKELAGQYWKGVLGRETIDLSANQYPYMFGLGPGYIEDSLVVSSNALAQTTRSITNNRHVNIDESDAAETTSDGFLYSVSGGSVHVTDLRDPSNLSTADVIELPASGAGLIVQGDSLIVITSQSVQGQGKFAVNSFFYQTRISVFDIVQRKNPQLKSTTVVDGSNIAARMTNGQLTLVQSHQNLLPQPIMVKGNDGIDRYESLDNYYTSNRDKILSSLLPDYSQGTGSTSTVASRDVGNWEDISIASDSLGTATSVIRFGLDDFGLSLLDSETITGLNAQSIYQGEDDIYLISSPSRVEFETKTYITRIDATSDGELNTIGVVGISGAISASSWLNEHNGVLQVASASSTVRTPVQTDAQNIDVLIFIPTFTVGANVTTVGETGGTWKVIGTLKDIASGQELLSANFIGDRAVLTTGTRTLVGWGDPLHGIDMSDPAHPKEMSELTIPGFTTYLQQIDQTHWLGLGYDQDSFFGSPAHLQISLYKVEDLANPEVVDTWVSSDIGWWSFWDPHVVSYDSATGLLTLTVNNVTTEGEWSPQPVFKIDVTAADPLKLVGAAEQSELVLRGFTVDNTYVAITGHSIRTYSVADSLALLDEIALPNYDSLGSIYWPVPEGATQKFSLPWVDGPFVITSVETSGPITATLNEDQSITLASPESLHNASQAVILRVRFPSGITRSVTANAYVQPKIDSTIVDPPTNLELRGSLRATFTDDAGKTITNLAKDDEGWITITATDTRDFATGVFAAYFDISFDTQNITVISEIEHLGEYSNGTSGTVSSDGIHGAGGFAGSTPPTSTSSAIVRFKIRVNNDQPVTLSITPSKDPGKEFLVYGASTAVSASSVSGFVLSTQTLQRLALWNYQEDINGDGVISALDVLRVVNYINARDEAAAESASAAASISPENFDITGDGVVSALDVLQIVNTINSRSESTASGEGPLDPLDVDHFFAVDLDSFERRKLK